MNDTARMKDWICRQIGRAHVFPRKLRATIMKLVIGEHPFSRPHRFRVPYHGYTYEGTTGSHIDWFVYYFGAYAEKGIDFLATLARKFEQPTFLDVGANSGTHTLALAEACGQIHCFEPYPRVLKSLRKHVNENGLKHVVVHEVGLSDCNQLADFYEDKSGNLGAGTFVAKQREPDCQLEIVIGDEYLENNVSDLEQIKLIKLDVEGLEMNVLNGLKNCLARSHPTVLWEFNSNNPLGNRDVILQRFPADYEHYVLTFKSRWTRGKPQLQRIGKPEYGDMVSVHRDNAYKICEFRKQ